MIVIFKSENRNKIAIMLLGATDAFMSMLLMQ